jgi:hypothetical protein
MRFPAEARRREDGGARSQRVDAHGHERPGYCGHPRDALHVGEALASSLRDGPGDERVPLGPSDRRKVDVRPNCLLGRRSGGCRPRRRGRRLGQSGAKRSAPPAGSWGLGHAPRSTGPTGFGGVIGFGRRPRGRAFLASSSVGFGRASDESARSVPGPLGSPGHAGAEGALQDRDERVDRLAPGRPRAGRCLRHRHGGGGSGLFGLSFSGPCRVGRGGSWRVRFIWGRGG